MKKTVIACLLLAAGIAPAAATIGWKGAGWYETSSYFEAVTGPFKTYQDCQKVAAPDQKAHPEYNYVCVFQDKDPRPD